MDIENYNIEIFNEFNKTWALVSAGSIGNYNSMTVSWGGMGTLWSRPVCTIYVRPSRYTYKFMEENEYFTVSFYDEEYREDLKIIGTKSGRDGDKIALTKLNVKEIDNAVTFKEAKKTLLCKKIYYQDMDSSKFPDEILEHYYSNDAVHRMYIGEVIAIY